MCFSCFGWTFRYEENKPDLTCLSIVLLIKVHSLSKVTKLGNTIHNTWYNSLKVRKRLVRKHKSQMNLLFISSSIVKPHLKYTKTMQNTPDEKYTIDPLTHACFYLIYESTISLNLKTLSQAFDVKVSILSFLLNQPYSLQTLEKLWTAQTWFADISLKSVDISCK